MLEELGQFLGVLVGPLQLSGANVALNATTAAQTLGTESNSLMYTWFIAMGGPFIDKSGDMLVATGDFVLSLSNFLISLTGLL